MTNNTSAARHLLTSIAKKGIELAVELGHLDPATATEADFHAAGQAAILAAAQMEPLVHEALFDLTVEHLKAA